MVLMFNFVCTMINPELSFSSQVNDLNQQYEEHYLKTRDLDGRLFFDGDETVLVPKVEM